MKYEHIEIAKEFKQKDEASNIYHCDTNSKGKAFYSLGMFPYPSGNAHIGHVRVYTLSDVKARFKKAQGYDVLHPIGWDSFGLPAENAAIQHKVRPDLWTQQNIEKMKNDQLNRAGWSFDWSKELNTSSPDYYRWTQWLFLQLYKAGKVVKKSAYVNWCEVDKTVLANEQVINGRCWRDDSPVEKKLMEQWFFKITDYAEQLWNDIEKLKNWAPEAVGVQRNWIGQKQGTHIKFASTQSNDTITVFTTRADTLFGVSALVIAPEHPLVEKIFQNDANPKLQEYVHSAMKKSIVERMQNKEKTGIKTTWTCKHPFANEMNIPPIPVWIGDYVIADFGTGAVMCVPAHDERDHEFAKKYALQIVEVIKPNSEVVISSVQEAAFTEHGILINSGKFSTLTSARAIEAIATELTEIGKGEKITTYQLKDWSVGRQRFWGCPIPIIYCPKCGPVPVPEDQLPVKLPDLAQVEINQHSLQLKEFSEFVHTSCPSCNDRNAKRETDTLDTFLCSSWYAFRFVDPKNSNICFDAQKANQFMPIDFYVGGLEHAAQHMIYFRFITKFLYEQKLIDFDEPVDYFFCNGMVRKDGHKMSKSRGNVVVPTEAIAQYGADAVRLYLLSDTPADFDIDWDDSGLQAKYEFVRRIFENISAKLEICKNFPENNQRMQLENQNFLYEFYAQLQKYQLSLESNNFNSSVAQIYTLYNLLSQELKTFETLSPDHMGIMKIIMREFLVSCSVIMPMFTDFLVRKYFGGTSVYTHPWPQSPSAYQEKKTATIVVQINGKKRAVVEIAKGSAQKDVELLLANLDELKPHLDGKSVLKSIYVQDKLLNLVVR
ncbi:MAG: leucine--tRNA ligase [Oligoflexales bacterium]|nr:leucine--tRNA ligase [Oligoflexales bacterium]